MTFALGLLAAALLGGGTDGPATPATTMIVYQFKVLEMEGLDWRSSLHPKLTKVARQGNATVWTSPGEAVATLVKKSRRVIAAPKITANIQAPATFNWHESRKLVTEMARTADGPVNHASYVAFEPKLSDAREGILATISGRKMDQGVLACLAMDDRQIAAVHSVSLAESLEKSTCADCEDSDATKLGVQVQVPETSHCEVTGEWLIPDSGALVVSFGVHTVANPNGWAVVRERLAVIEAKAVEGKMEMKAVYRPAQGPELPGHMQGRVGRDFHIEVLSPSVFVPSDSSANHFVMTPLPLPAPRAINAAAASPSAAPIPMPVPAPPAFIYGNRGRDIHIIQVPSPPNFDPSQHAPSHFIMSPLPILDGTPTRPTSSSTYISMAIPMSPPTPPTRWRPADGAVIEPPLVLPPLPVESSLPSASAAPMPAAPTPRPRVSSAKTKVDPAFVKASAVDTMFTSVLAAILPAKSTAKSGWIPLGGGKTFEIYLPVLGNVEVNVQAYARPKPAEAKKSASSEPD